MKHSVVVVDDHILLSEAISELVNGFENFKTLYSCKNGKELLTMLKDPKNIPEIVLMDVNMPILNGIDATAELKQHHPQIKVIALSVETEEKTIINMLRAGAKGYLVKDTKKEILEEALNEVLQKGYYHTNTIAQLLIGSLTKEEDEMVLKDREIEFITHACSEKTYKEIADLMFLSPKTIEGYRDVLYAKLNLKNRIGLVLYAIRNNLFKP
ncbi:response regulator transcription factor [Lacinutrix himadriensis]|uniref:response regulator transcription factor n=1 Tax=Lacinutrix himadriensis TaxID=641549 RepID=UPI0006E3ABA3|nr:response regulator transcription factor [Lacinutrix himadriensis]